MKFLNNYKFWSIGLALLAGVVASSSVAATATTPEFRLSIKHDGIRASAGDEMLRYSSIWDGGSNETAKVTIAQNGATLVANLMGEGDQAWSVSQNGTYALTHTTYTNGEVAAVLTATFVVTGKDVPFPEGSVTVTGWSGKYDGQPHSISVTTTGIESPTITYALDANGPFDATNPTFTTITNQTVWCVIAADGYITETNSASVVITEGDIGGGPGGDEPGPGEIPEGGLSKFDATYVYDGEGHTINTQALYAVTLAGATPSFSFAKDDGGQGLPALPDTPNWIGEAPAYTNAGKYVVWYRITAPNYSNYIHSARVTITNKPVRVVSAVAHQRYPWNGLVDIDVTFDGEPGDLAQVECTFAATNGATQTALPITYISRGGTDTGSGRAWKRRYVWNAAGDVGAVKIDDLALSVHLRVLGAVQLWENGPYWAECNVGASKPEDSGYYFWWGDTVGYKRNVAGTGWVSAADGESFTFDDSNCATYGKDCSVLQPAGYVDETLNLAAVHDAASMHLGTLWRMPTAADMTALGANCTNEWKTCNGVYGLLVSGKGAFATKSIFLPAAGIGCGASVMRLGVRGHYWTSTPNTPHSLYYSAALGFTSSGIGSGDGGRETGQTVRPLRGFADDMVTISEEGVITHIKIDCAAGARASSGIETLRYSSQWDGGTNTTAKVTIKQGETVLVENLTGEGERAWNVTRPGLYTLTHTTYTNSAVAKTLTAQFEVSGVPVPPGEVVVTPYDGVYDGAAHGISVTGPEGTTVKFCATSNGVYAAELAYTDVCATQIWYEVSGGGWLAYTNSAALKILPRSVTVKSQDLTKTYDGTPLKLTTNDITTSCGGLGQPALPEGESFVYGDLAERIDVGQTSATFSIAAGANTKLSNYTITPAYGTLTVEKKDIGGGGEDDPDKPDPTKPDAVSRFDCIAMYDGAGHTIDTNAFQSAFEKAMIGEFAVEYAANAAGGGAPALPWASEPPVFTNACEEIVWYKVTNPNYADYVHAAKVTVTNRLVTITSASASWVYDTTTHATNGIDVTSGSFVAGDGVDIDEESFPLITDVGSKQNTFMWSLSEGTRATNYAISVVYGAIAVTPRQIGDDPANWDIRLGETLKYNGAEQSAPIKLVAYRKPDGNLTPIPYVLEGNKGTNAANYKVKISGTGNYAGTITNDWAIVPRNLTMTSATTNWVYDGESHCASNVVVTGDGFVGEESATYGNFPVVTHALDTATPIDNEFAYELANGAKAQNYSVKQAYGTVQVTPRPITLTGPTMTREYNGTAHTYGADDIVASDIGYAGEERFMLGGFKSQTEAGSVATSFTVADGTALMSDYSVTSVAGMLTVKANASEITVTARSKSWVYDGAAHTLNEYDADNLDVLTAGDELEVTFDDASSVMTPVDGPNRDGVVENRIKSVRVIRGGTKDVSDNYTLGKVSGTLTVTKRPVTLTSKSAEKTYDGAALTAHEVIVSGDGFVSGDGASYTYTGTQTNVGESDNTFSYALNEGTMAAYYDIATVNGKLKVNPADISVGGEGDFVAVLDASPTYSGIPQSQTLSSVKYRGLDVDYSLSDNQQTDAGTYQLKVTGKGNFTGVTNVTWTLSPKALSLTAGSASKVYDGAELTCGSVTESGFVAGEGATYVCAGAQLDVGSSENVVATINWNAGTKSTNYAVTKNKGTLAVTARPVLVKSKDITKPYDGTALTLTAGEIEAMEMVAGESFVYGDFASRTEFGQTSATFSIAAGANTKLTNYAITPQYGTITITKSATEIGVTAASETWVYDGETHSNNTYTATNLDTLQEGDALVVAFDPASFVKTPQDGPGGDGKVVNAITSVKVMRNGTTDVTEYYTVTPYTGMLTVTKRPVTVTVVGDSETVTYDGEEHTVQGYETTTEDELYDIEADTSFSGTDAVKGTDAATYAMGLKASDFANKNDCFEVTYAVTDGKLIVNPADISTNGGADCAITLGANPKYNGTLQTIQIVSVTYKDLPVTYSLTGESATHANAAITLTVKGTGNFSGEKSTTWAMLKRAVVITSRGAAKTYDGTALTESRVDVTGDGFAGEEGANYTITGMQTEAGTSKNAFTYELKAGTLEGNYDITTVFGDLVVNKAKYPGQEQGGAGITWNVTSAAAAWMYDGAEHGVTVTGVPTGVTPVYTSNVAKDAGEYTASVSFVYDAANYEAPVAPASIKWSITQRPITLMAASKDKPYDGFPLEVEPGDITASGSGYAAGECFDYYDRASITDVGETPATFKYRDSTTAKVANYVVTVKGGQTLKVTVGGDQISVTSDSETWAYDGEEHTKKSWTFVNESKLLAGHEFQIKIADTSKIGTPKDGPEHNGIVSNAFEYVKIVETSTGKDRTKNYNLFVYEGVLQMTNRVICSEELRMKNEEFKPRIEKVYDGMATQVVVSAALLQPETVRYWCDDGGQGLTSLPDDADWRDEPYAFTHATNAVVWFTVAADYYNTYTGKIEIAIAKRPVVVKTPTKSKAYDGGALTFGEDEVGISLTGGALGDRALPLGESFVYGDFASIIDAGKIDSTCSIAAGANTSLDDYDITKQWGTLTVLASADQITVTAKNGEWTYDAQPHELHEYVAENESKLLSGDTLSVIFDTASVITNPDDGPKADGIVSNVITSVRVMRGDVDVTKNYSLAWYGGTLRVVNANMPNEKVKVKSEEVVYDGDGHTVEVSVDELLTSPVTIRYGLTADAVTLTVPPDFTDAGTHTVFYQISAKYYNTYSGSATVTIKPRPITLVSGSATRVYNGQPLKNNEVTVKEGSLDFVKSEGFSATCSGTITNVGGMENLFDYELTGGAKSDNYTIKKEYGWLRITPATLDPGKVFGGAGTEENPLVCEKVFNGLAQGYAPTITFSEKYQFHYALVPGDESAYSPESPTRRNVSEGDLKIYFKFVSPNYDPFYGVGILRVIPKGVTVEMLDYSDDAFFYDGAKTKVPDVILVDTNEFGTVISTSNDYIRIYGERLESGEWPVTLIGTNNYTDAATALFRNIKRPVAPPVIPSAQYNGTTRVPTVPADSRWTVVSNPGGVNAGEYTNVVLRLTNTADYKWKGYAEDGPDTWTGVFVITRAPNGWRVYPGIKSWTCGETPSEPTATPKHGTFSVAYRKRGAAVETETGERPSAVGLYTARFWVEATQNYYGVSSRDVDFEIYESTAGDTTVTTPVPVPKSWLAPYVDEFGGGNYETAGNATGRNGRKLWECYVAGLEPTDPNSQFTANISIGSDGVPRVTWSPDLSDGNPPRTYTTVGKKSLADTQWTAVTDENKSQMKFFRVQVNIQ